MKLDFETCKSHAGIDEAISRTTLEDITRLGFKVSGIILNDDKVFIPMIYSVNGSGDSQIIQLNTVRNTSGKQLSSPNLGTAVILLWEMGFTDIKFVGETPTKQYSVQNPKKQTKTSTSKVDTVKKGV